VQGVSWLVAQLLHSTICVHPGSTASPHSPARAAGVLLPCFAAAWAAAAGLLCCWPACWALLLLCTLCCCVAVMFCYRPCLYRGTSTCSVVQGLQAPVPLGVPVGAVPLCSRTAAPLRCVAVDCCRCVRHVLPVLLCWLLAAQVRTFLCACGYCRNAALCSCYNVNVAQHIYACRDVTAKHPDAIASPRNICKVLHSSRTCATPVVLTRTFRMSPIL
jgi:hypothetical protein